MNYQRRCCGVVIIVGLLVGLSCGSPEATPQNIDRGMTKKQVLRKFGNPDQLKARYEAPPVKTTPIIGTDGTVMHDGVISEGRDSPETWWYYNDDGTLITRVRFSDEGEVIDVSRGPVTNNR